MSAVEVLMECSLLEPSFTALTLVPDKNQHWLSGFFHLFIYLFYLHANPLKSEIQALHSDLLLLAVPIPSILAHVLPIIWRAPESLLEGAVITSQSLWSWFLVKAQVVKLSSFFRCKLEELVFETALSLPPFFTPLSLPWTLPLMACLLKETITHSTVCSGYVYYSGLKDQSHWEEA